eukprot:GHVS01018047.1.p1 GENE.GHVS01018047.1~~GHVS01018047.1.p1  ORF type:complete len:169 (+),score=10.30 GHVS01018047.1:360-866(+)
MRKPARLSVGDLVVHHKSAYQLRSELLESECKKYTLDWSLPCKVVEVRDKAVTVSSCLRVAGEMRSVPLAMCRKLTIDLPESLLPMTYESLGVVKPRRAPELSMWKVVSDRHDEPCESVTVDGHPLSQQHLGMEASVQSESPQAGSKRRRTLPLSDMFPAEGSVGALM